MINSFDTFLDLLKLLDEEKIYYSLDHTREETVRIDVSVPGQRWEIDFYADGHLEVEIFRSDGKMHGSEYLSHLIAKQRS